MEKYDLESVPNVLICLAVKVHYKTWHVSKQLLTPSYPKVHGCGKKIFLQQFCFRRHLLSNNLLYQPTTQTESTPSLAMLALLWLNFLFN